MRSEDKEYRATIAPATSMKIRWRSIAILWHKFAPSNTRFLSEPHRPAHDLLHVADRRTGAHTACARLEGGEAAPCRATSMPQAAERRRDWLKSQDSPRRARNGQLVSSTVHRSPAEELKSARAKGPRAKIGAYAGMDRAL